MILLIDNYDSFSYNLFQLIGSIEPDIQVVRNDAMTVDEIRELNPDGIILSPGPGKPSDAGICIEVAAKLGKDFPILGVCLGHQSICEAYGATVSYAKQLMHGKQSDTDVDVNCELFKGLPATIPVARYHSLAVVEDTLEGTPLQVIARTTDGEIMGVKHNEYPVYGLQFHPESIMTPSGKDILKNAIGLMKKGK